MLQWITLCTCILHCWRCVSLYILTSNVSKHCFHLDMWFHFNIGFLYISYVKNISGWALPPEILFETVCGMDEASVATKISQMVLFYKQNWTKNIKWTPECCRGREGKEDPEKEAEKMERREKNINEGNSKSRQEWWMASNVCGFVIYIKKYIFDLCPYSGHRIPKTFRISWVIRAIRVSLLC